MKLDHLIRSWADASLQHEEVFADHGHGALVYTSGAIPLDFVAVTGPRRQMLKESSLPIHYAVPFGDMMMSGCFGLIMAWAAVFPHQADQINAALENTNNKTPWD